MLVSIFPLLCPRKSLNVISTDLPKKINAAQLNPDMLVSKYIPNLVAKTFKVSCNYAQLIYDQTLSPCLDKVLKKWDQDNWAAPKQRQNLAYIILVELLAYQFASPVQWIKTQDLLFGSFEFKHLIKVGPSPTLTGMASRTLKAKCKVQDDSVTHPCTILCYAKNGKEIYYQFEDEVVAEAKPTPKPSTPVPPTPAPAASAPATPAPSSSPVASIEDVPIKASDILNVIVAQKLKKKVFDPLKAFRFDSSWNWVRQDALVMFYEFIFSCLPTVDREITARCIALLNHADPELLTYMQYHIDQVDPSKGNTYQLAKQFGQQLIDNTCKVIGQPPVYKDGMSDFYF